MPKRDLPRVRRTAAGPVPEALRHLGERQFVQEHYWIEVRQGQWTAAYRMAVRSDGRVQVAEVRLFPSASRDASAPGEWPGTHHTAAPVPGHGVTAALLRTLRPVVAYNLLTAERARMTAIAVEAMGTRADGTERRRPGRPRRPDLFYARLAGAYVRALAAGSSRPAAEVAKAMAISGGLVRVHLHEARERGLLTRPQPGHSGGTLTVAGRSVLRRGGRHT